MPAVLMAAPGTLDTTFTNPNLNAPAYAVAILPDGGLLAAGEFTTAGPDSTPYERLARFNADGTLDTTFTDPRLRPIYQVAVRGDGKILVVGNFTTAGPDNTPYGRLARLNLDGSLDTTFTNPNLNRPTYQLAVQPDEKVLVTGGSTTAGPDNTPYGRLARFNADGTLDTTFTDPNLNNTGYALAVQSDGKILVGGSFTTAGPDNTPYGRLARFHPDGTLDTTFTNPNLDGNVWDLAVQGDGSVLVTGTFNGAGPGNTTYGRLARFHPDGTLDTTFTNAGLNGYGKALAVQSDGKILVAGTFESAGPTGTHYGRLARFHPDGTLDTTFTNPRLDADGNGLRLLGDGKILVPGRFSTAGTAGTASGYLARFHG